MKNEIKKQKLTSKSTYQTLDQTMQAMFDMLELNKRIVEGIVEVVESDNNSEASVKLKRLVKLIKSKTYKQK